MNHLKRYLLDRSFFYFFVAILLSFTLIVFASIQTISSAFLISGDQELDQLRNGNTLTGEQIDRLISSREKSLLAWNTGQKWTDLGLAYLLKAPLQKPRTEKRQTLEKAISSLQKGLALAPSNPWGWTRLAHAHILLNGPSNDAAQALVRAIVVAPYEPNLHFTRLALCFSAWPYFPKTAWPLVFKQIRVGWRVSPQKLVDLATQKRRVQIVRSALLEDQNALKGFESLLLKSLTSSKQ